MADAIVSGAVGFHVVNQTMSSPGEALVDLSCDGAGTTLRFVLRKVGTEWKFQALTVASQ